MFICKILWWLFAKPNTMFIYKKKLMMVIYKTLPWLFIKSYVQNLTEIWVPVMTLFDNFKK